jgi:hypothetical protein
VKPVCRALIARRVLEQVLLVIVLSRIPVLRGRNLRHDLEALRVEVLRLNFGGDPLGDLLLLGAMVKDGGAILCKGGVRFMRK